MAFKQREARAADSPAALKAAEWDFKSLPDLEKWPCMAYELLRESAFMHEEAAAALGYYQTAARAKGFNPTNIALPNLEDFVTSYPGSRLLALAFMAMNGFPDLPWQEIKHKIVRGKLGSLLQALSLMPRCLDHGATVYAAVQQIDLVQDDELREELRQAGVTGSSMLCWSSQSLPAKYAHALLIDPSADEAMILEGIRAYLPTLREKADLLASVKKPKKGGRKPNHSHPETLLGEIGLMRLAHYLPVKIAWETFHAGRKSGEINIAIKRARESCAAAMHAHFELPGEEKPLHFLKPKTKVTKTQG